MKAVRVIVGGVLVYAATLALFIHVFAVPAKSDWYWVPFIASLATVVGLGTWRRRTPLTLTLLGVVLSAGIVFALDLTLVTWYSCSQGVCS